MSPRDDAPRIDDVPARNVVSTREEVQPRDYVCRYEITQHQETAPPKDDLSDKRL